MQTKTKQSKQIDIGILRLSCSCHKMVKVLRILEGSKWIHKEITSIYYMAKRVLGKSLCSDWFFLGQDFAVQTVSTEMVQSVYFCFGAKPGNSKFATKTAKKKCE